ncbi:hypothetical protein SCALM49S_00017 [Streptomyces californicus]
MDPKSTVQYHPLFRPLTQLFRLFSPQLLVRALSPKSTSSRFA